MPKKYITLLLSVLRKPTLSLNVTKTQFSKFKIHQVAALKGASAVIHYEKSKMKWSLKYRKRLKQIIHQVSKIDNRGEKEQKMYNCTWCSITGLIILGEDIFIIIRNRTWALLQIRLVDGKLLQVHPLKVSMQSYIVHTGSLSSDPARIPDNDQLLLVDKITNEVLTYRWSTRKKLTRVRNLYANPRSVSYVFYNNTFFYIVCISGRSKVNIYDHGWKFVRSSGALGKRDGQLKGPRAAIVSPDNAIIVADYWNNRLSEFTVEGEFVCQILDTSDGIIKPEAFSPYLWVIHSDDKLYRYKYN